MGFNINDTSRPIDWNKSFSAPIEVQLRQVRSENAKLMSLIKDLYEVILAQNKMNGKDGKIFKISV